jgi:hypothetical protein
MFQRSSSSSSSPHRWTGFDFTAEVISRMAVGYYATGDVAPLISLGWEVYTLSSSSSSYLISHF